MDTTSSYKRLEKRKSHTKMELRVLYETHERMRICKRNRPFKKQEPLPHKFEWIEMEIAKNREEYG